MSINSELTRLDAVRDALVSSVNAKGGSLSADATLWQVKAGVDAIEQGGGECNHPVVSQPSPTVSVNSSTGVVTAKYTPVAGLVEDTAEKTGTMQLTKATQPAPTATIDKSTGKVTAEYTPVAGLVSDTGKKSAELQLTTQGAQTIMPGTSDKTIASGRYLTGTQTIKGDSNLAAGNIKKGVSIFNVSGEYEGEGSGGGGAFDLVKVTEYTPYQAPFSGITKVTFSGFGYDEMSGMDFSEYNGDWTVENPDEPDPLKRTFKRNDRYLYYFPDPDNNWGGDAWCINSNKQNGGYNAELYYNSTTELTNGTINWYSMMGSATTTCTVTKASYPEVQFVLKGQKATAYDPATKQWTFDSSVLSFSATEKQPRQNAVFATNGETLIGNMVALDVNGLVWESPHNLTSNTSNPDFIVDQSSYYSSNTLAWNVFDDRMNIGQYGEWTYNSPDGVATAWISMQLRDAYPVNYLKLVSAGYSNSCQPASFNLEYSEDGATWTPCLQVSGLTQTWWNTPSVGAEHEWEVPVVMARYYRLNMLTRAGHSSYNLQKMVIGYK